MPPRYIIHLGPLKTGSTYLQHCLTDASEKLAEQGVYYPKSFHSGNNFMHMGIYKAMRRKDLGPLKNEFSKINAAGYRDVVLSCEHFIFLRPKMLQALVEATGASSVLFVYTSRRWSDRYSSLWNQSLYMGGTSNLPEFYLSLLSEVTPDYYPRFAIKAQSGPEDLDYSLCWRGLEQTFGRDALSIFSYSNIMDEKGDIFARFCRDILALQTVPDTSLAGSRFWPSMPPADQEILRVLNELHLHKNGQESGKVRAHFMRSRETLDTATLVEAINGSMRELVIDDAAPQFAESYSRMSEFQDRVVGGGPVFAKRAKQAKYASPSYLMQAGVRENLRSLYAAIETKLAQD